jgi:steroid 5-alpha reductase family enzyme
MVQLYYQASFLIFILVTILWIWSVYLKDVSIVDIFWGLGFVILNIFYVFNSGDLNSRKILLLVLVSVWGLRLSIYLAYRNIGKGEDFRYQEFRRKFGPKRYWWFSYFQAFLLQGALMILISITLLGMNFSSQPTTLSTLDYIGIGIWLIGFIFEAGGDYQLMRFKKNTNNKGNVLTTGFWKYTRHPNYFGDASVWWSYAIFSISAGAYWQIIGSILMTLLIINISGVTLLEKSLKQTKTAYSDYIDKTSSFFPWFQKK